MNLSEDHRRYLLGSAISADVLEASGIYTVEDPPSGIIFPWADGTGAELIQLRPDNPVPDETGRLIKYRFPAGSELILNRLRDTGEGPALLVEGTKQQYAALSHAPEEFAVYGVSGCWGWVDADLSWVMDRDVYVLFDGDVSTNKDVHRAATELSEQLDLNGAQSVKFVRTTARKTDGLDDVLAKISEGKRAEYLQLWIDKALPKLPRPPAKKEQPFFEKGALQVQQATKSLLDTQPAALTAERKVALYLGGSYHIDGTAFLASVSKQLGDQYRPSWRSAMEEVAVGLLFQEGLFLPEQNEHAVLNCANGMLDLKTLELTPHSPHYLSTVQVPIAWDPDAKAPHYEAWLAQCCPLQIADLEEVAGTMLDPSRTPHKAAFLFGPSRSGKSTFLRLLQSIAGVENRTAVTLHDLARDRFAAANVYGKILNSAADLSSAHVEDLSVFKMMTGEDPIHGNRKYGSQFTFTNQALFAFSANELPTVSESSRAYAERIKPFEFPVSFAGRENPLLEGLMRAELPGILVRWVKAYRRVMDRGGYTETDAQVRREFETRSDRVAQWVADVCQIIDAVPGQNLPEDQSTSRRESARLFNSWAERNSGSKMGERKIFDRLGQIRGIVEVRAGRNRSRAFNIVVKDNPDADLDFSIPGPRQSVEVRAERALSNHPSHTSNPLPPALSTKSSSSGSEEVHGKGALKVPVLPALPDPFECAEVPGQVQTNPDTQSCAHPVAPVLGFDLETASAAELWTGGHSGPFVRLGGTIADSGSATEAYSHSPSAPFAPLLEALDQAEVIYGHNILGYDLLALARHNGADYDKLAAKAVDLLPLARLLDPPMARDTGSTTKYDLDTLAQRLGHTGKSDNLKALAEEHGGYDKIPVNDPRYVSYLQGDLAATEFVYKSLYGRKLDAYEAREMRVVAIQNRMTLNGWAVDTALLAERVAEEDAKREEAATTLHTEFGMPLAPPDKIKLKLKREWTDQSFSIEEARALKQAYPDVAVDKGLAVRVPQEPYAAPWNSAPGKAAIIEAFAAAGAEHYPKTATGDIAINKDAMGSGTWYDKAAQVSKPGMLRAYPPDQYPKVARIVEMVKLATGASDKYAEVARFLTPEGRVHAEVGAAQASGRWATSKPAGSNFGKHGEKGQQRAIYIADPGHVLVTCDQSQVDMRAVAGLCQDLGYMALFEPGRDAHMDMAEVFFGERTKEARRRTKAINHKVNYGGSARSTAEMNGLDLGLVQRALDARAEAYPRLIEWTGEVRDIGAAGQLLDNGFGRLMRCDPERAWTQAPALMGQGAARDLMCEGLLRLVTARPDVTPYLRGVIHDEVILSVPEGEAAEWQGELKQAFTFTWRDVPILCEVSEPARNWADCYLGE